MPSQAKKGRVSSGAQAIQEVNKRMDRMADIFEKGLMSLTSLPAAPSTPRHHDRAPVAESSPVRAQTAVSQAASLEIGHLGAVNTTKFLCYLEMHSAVVITYNMLVKLGNEVLRKEYVAECVRRYEEEQDRKDLGL